MRPTPVPAANDPAVVTVRPPVLPGFVEIFPDAGFDFLRTAVAQQEGGHVTVDHGVGHLFADQGDVHLRAIVDLSDAQVVLDNPTGGPWRCRSAGSGRHPPGAIASNTFSKTGTQYFA